MQIYDGKVDISYVLGGHRVGSGVWRWRSVHSKKFAQVGVGSATAVVGQSELLVEADTYINRGHAHVALGQHQLAIQDYDEAIRLDPELAVAYGDRALAYTLLGKHKEAQQDVDRAVELGADSGLLEMAINFSSERKAAARRKRTILLIYSVNGQGGAEGGGL